MKLQHPRCSVCGPALQIGGAVALLLALVTQQSCVRAQMVIAVPEVRHLQLEDGDEFLILACDGIWDVLSNQEVTLLPSTPSHVSCWHMCSLVPGMSGRSSGTNAHSSTHWRALCASEAIQLSANAGIPVGGGLCAQAPGEAHDAAGHLRGHV